MQKGQVHFYSLRLATTKDPRITFNFITVDGIKNGQKRGLDFLLTLKKKEINYGTGKRLS